MPKDIITTIQGDGTGTVQLTPGSGLNFITSDPIITTYRPPALRVASVSGPEGVGIGGAFRPFYLSRVSELHSPPHNYNLAYGVITKSEQDFLADEETFYEIGEIIGKWQMLKYFRNPMLPIQSYDLLKAMKQAVDDPSSEELVLFNRPHNEIWHWYKQMGVDRLSLSMEGSGLDDLYGKWVVGYRLSLIGTMGIYLLDKYSRNFYVKILMVYHDDYSLAHSTFFDFAAKVCNISKDWMGKLS